MLRASLRHLGGLVLLMGLLPLSAHAQGDIPSPTDPPLPALVRTVDLDVRETREVTLHNGETVTLQLLSVHDERDQLMGAVRALRAEVEVNGEPVTLHGGNYNLPVTVGGVQIDFPAALNFVADATVNWWGIERHARFRLWPADAPFFRPGTFVYPLKQRWFASVTWFSNEPVSMRPTGKIYYHAGMDFGGAEGLVEVVSATDGYVVSAGGDTLRRMPAQAPEIGSHYANVWIVDDRGWYHNYTHLYRIDVAPGDRVCMGQRIGLLGKESASGGYAHLHYEIKSLQPSGRWGTMDAYPFIWQAYHEAYAPALIAVARPRHRAHTGEAVVLDGSRSWSRHGTLRYEWTFSDGTTAEGPRVTRVYDQPGSYNEILKITDGDGRVDYDFADVRVVEPGRPRPPGVHAAYYPTFGLQPGDAVTFQVRARGTTEGYDVWDFGDGSPPVRVYSNPDPAPHAPDGYASVTHRFAEAGHYLVKVQRINDHGVGTQRLHVIVGEETR